MKFKLVIVFFIVVLVIQSCHSSKKIIKTDPALLSFGNMIVGEYNSEAQSKLDSDYLNISLVMVKIWDQREDGYWIYVEQALASKMEKPYRQRVYQIIKKGEQIVSKIYQFNDPLNYAGAFHDSIKLSKLTFDKLSTKEGCDVVMDKKGDVYEGGTIGKNCLSTLKGSVYASTEIKLSLNELKSWDRGFDEDDKQVWGAEKGPYIFIKKKATNKLIQLKPQISSN